MTAEPYLTAVELAGEMRVSVRTIRKWTAAGMPSETWGMRVRRYRLSEAISWATAVAGASTINGNPPTRPERLMSARAPDSEE